MSFEAGRAAEFVLNPGRMRYRFEIPPHHVMLIACALALIGLVHAEGWIWPRKAAAVMIPVSFLVG
jgi:hypothetical protein